LEAGAATLEAPGALMDNEDEEEEEAKINK